MTIKIIPEPTIHLTQSQYDRLKQEYERTMTFMVNPPSFESFVRQRLGRSEQHVELESIL